MVPAGTRNHFARDLELDRADPAAAIEAFVAGPERRVDVATVGERLFLNNASLGVYDGEPAVFDTPVEFRIHGGALRVLLPPSRPASGSFEVQVAATSPPGPEFRVATTVERPVEGDMAQRVEVDVGVTVVVEADAVHGEAQRSRVVVVGEPGDLVDGRAGCGRQPTCPPGRSG